jgi:membrane protein
MRYVRELWLRLMRDDCAGMAAEIAYHWVLAIIPVLIFLFSLFGIVTSRPELFIQVLEVLRRIIPEEAFSLVANTLAELTRDSNSSLAIVSFLAALWTASNGALVVEKALNRAYSKSGRRRNFWRQRMVAIFSVLGVGLIILVATNLVVFGKMLIAFIEHWFRPPVWILAWMTVLRWLMSVGGLLAVSLFIYTIGPERKEQRAWKTIWPGALTFVALWIFTSLLFGEYVTNLGSYNKVYGSMGAIVVLMVWLYLTSFALLVGGEVNAMIWRHTIGRKHRPGKPSQYRRFYT